MIRRGLGQGQGKGYKNLVPNDPYVHSLSAKGVKTLQSQTVNLNAKSLQAMGSMRNFKIDDEYSVNVWSESTSRGFRHVAVLLRNGREVDKQTVNYLNRTWEAYPYQTAIQKLLDKNFPENEAEFKYKKLEQQRGHSVYAKGKAISVGNFVKTVGYVVPYEGTVKGFDGVYAIVEQGNATFRLPIKDLEVITRLSTNTRDKYHKQPNTLFAKGEFEMEQQVMGEDMPENYGYDMEEEVEEAVPLVPLPPPPVFKEKKETFGEKAKRFAKKEAEAIKEGAGKVRAYIEEKQIEKQAFEEELKNLSDAELQELAVRDKPVLGKSKYESELLKRIERRKKLAEEVEETKRGEARPSGGGLFGFANPFALINAGKEK